MINDKTKKGGEKKKKKTGTTRTVKEKEQLEKSSDRSEGELNKREKQQETTKT